MDMFKALIIGANIGQKKGVAMKGLLNNELSVKTLNNLKNGLDNRICEIYNQGYREGYKDATEEVLQSIKENLLGKKFVTEEESEE